MLYNWEERSKKFLAQDHRQYCCNFALYQLTSVSLVTRYYIFTVCQKMFVAESLYQTSHVSLLSLWRIGPSICFLQATCSFAITSSLPPCLQFEMISLLVDRSLPHICWLSSLAFAFRLPWLVLKQTSNQDFNNNTHSGNMSLNSLHGVPFST